MGDDQVAHAPRRPVFDIDLEVIVTPDPGWQGEHGNGTYFKTRHLLRLLTDVVANAGLGFGDRWKVSGTVGENAT